MTAEELIMQSDIMTMAGTKQKAKDLMIEFAKLKVEEALEAASIWVGEWEGTDFKLKESYPLTNIK